MENFPETSIDMGDVHFWSAQQGVQFLFMGRQCAVLFSANIRGTRKNVSHTFVHQEPIAKLELAGNTHMKSHACLEAGTSD